MQRRQASDGRTDERWLVITHTRCGGTRGLQAGRDGGSVGTPFDYYRTEF
jgi:hypothetical protein